MLQRAWDALSSDLRLIRRDFERRAVLRRIALALAATAFVAALVPARRAAATDPIEALRAE